MNHSQPHCRSRRSSGQARGQLAAAACLLLAGQPVQAQSAGDQVVSFLAACRTAGVDGLPDGARFAQIAEYLSPGLSALITGAQATHSAHARNHPGDKPPLADGDLFSSLFEGPSGFEIADSGEHGERAWVLVNFRYLDPRPASTVVRWSDRYLLVRPAPGAAWRIDDVEYLGQWEFARKGRLSDALRAAASVTP